MSSCCFLLVAYFSGFSHTLSFLYSSDGESEALILDEPPPIPQEPPKSPTSNTSSEHEDQNENKQEEEAEEDYDNILDLEEYNQGEDVI